jgi:putative ABC transport system ATP-binding protein
MTLPINFRSKSRGGQAQRVSLVRATVNDPALLLADEPTGQVDHATGVKLIDHLLAWADDVGATIVIATHDLEVADRMQTILRMDHGVLLSSNERILQ